MPFLRPLVLMLSVLVAGSIFGYPRAPSSPVSRSSKGSALPCVRSRWKRKTAYPWPAMSPEVLDESPRRHKIEGGTPQFQAFAVEAKTLRAITPPGTLAEVMAQLSPMNGGMGGFQERP